MHRAIGVTATFVSGLLIAAHFLRHGLHPLVTVAVAFPMLLFIRKPWATRAVQILLVLSAFLWLHTLVTLAVERRAAAQPWIRMAIILGVVVFFTAWNAFAVRHRKMKDVQPDQGGGSIRGR